MNPQSKTKSHGQNWQDDSPIIYTPKLVNLATVTPKAVEWLWPFRIPLGKLTLIAGEPGLGKSFLTMDMAARITQGMPWPDNPNIPAPMGSVILLSAEDDVADTIRPRLDAAGADCSKIVAIQGVEFQNQKAGATHERSFNLESDLPALEHAILSAPNPRCVFIDPVSAYLGGKDSHKNAEIRGLLAPLSDLAAKYMVAVIAVTHLNKCGGQKAMHRFTGSLAFIAAARAGWLIASDKENPKRRLMLPVKTNLAEDVDGLAYSIIDGVLAWESGRVSVSADDALGEDVRKDGHTEKDDASAWLRELLADGRMSPNEIKELAQENGYSWATVRRAKTKLGIDPKKEGFGKDSQWFWGLPASKALEDAEDAQPPDVSTLSAFDESEHLSEEPGEEPEGDWGDL